MLVESVVALGFLVGLLQPDSPRAWLLGDGSGFAAAYQVISVVWIIGLFILAVRATTQRNWMVSAIIGITSVVFYALPIGLFIR